ncbi:MAG: YncE family protein [Candidatus Kapaibacterium sp.]
MKTILLSLALIGISCAELSHDDHEDVNVDYAAAYVVNGYGNTISVIRQSDHVVSATMSLHGAMYPHHIAYDSLRKILAVAITGTDLSGGHDHGGGSVEGLKIMILDAVTGRMLKELPCSGMPHNAMFVRAGAELWFSEADSVRSRVRVVSTADWTPVRSIDVGGGLSEVSISDDGTRVFATNTKDGTVSVIDPGRYEVVATIPVGVTPVGAWPAANGCMYVDNEGSRSVSEIVVKTASPGRTIDCGFMPAFVLYTPSKELWITDATNGRVVWYTDDGAEWRKAGEIVTGLQAHALALDSDGTTVYCTNQGAHTVSVIDAARHTVVATIAVGRQPNGIVMRK